MNRPERSVTENIGVMICCWGNGSENCDCHNLKRQKICLEAEKIAEKIINTVKQE